jgi:hypothetical protein
VVSLTEAFEVDLCLQTLLINVAPDILIDGLSIHLPMIDDSMSLRYMYPPLCDKSIFVFDQDGFEYKDFIYELGIVTLAEQGNYTYFFHLDRAPDLPSIELPLNVNICKQTQFINVTQSFEINKFTI